MQRTTIYHNQHGGRLSDGRSRLLSALRCRMTGRCPPRHGQTVRRRGGGAESGQVTDLFDHPGGVGLTCPPHFEPPSPRGAAPSAAAPGTAIPDAGAADPGRRTNVINLGHRHRPTAATFPTTPAGRRQHRRRVPVPHRAKGASAPPVPAGDLGERVAAAQREPRERAFSTCHDGNPVDPWPTRKAQVEGLRRWQLHHELSQKRKVGSEPIKGGAHRPGSGGRQTGRDPGAQQSGTPALPRARPTPRSRPRPPGSVAPRRAPIGSAWSRSHRPASVRPWWRQPPRRPRRSPPRSCRSWHVPFPVAPLVGGVRPPAVRAPPATSVPRNQDHHQHRPGGGRVPPTTGRRARTGFSDPDQTAVRRDRSEPPSPPPPSPDGRPACGPHRRSNRHPPLTVYSCKRRSPCRHPWGRSFPLRTPTSPRPAGVSTSVSSLDRRLSDAAGGTRPASGVSTERSDPGRPPLPTLGRARGGGHQRRTDVSRTGSGPRRMGSRPRRFRTGICSGSPLRGAMRAPGSGWCGAGATA